MRPVCSYTDFFVVCTGGNPRQTKAIWDEIHAGLKLEDDLLPRSVEGATEATWIVGDYIDVVVHVFTPEARESTASRISGTMYRTSRSKQPRPEATLARLPGPIAQLGERRAGTRRSPVRARLVHQLDVDFHEADPASWLVPGAD